MGSLELWLGPSGAGKTGKALDLLRRELAADWRGVRYLVPTVGHARSLEQLLLQTEHPGLFGAPIIPFFAFAEEVAERAQLRGQRLTDLQQLLLLRALVRETPLDFFARAREFPGFTQALREAIDELKVQMIWPQRLLDQAGEVEARGLAALAGKMREIGALYQAYQERVRERALYDSEGIMWTAAECLRATPNFFPELRLLILDGFSRLTPIQAAVLRALAPSVERIIVLFDYEEEHGERALYHPVRVSLRLLRPLEDDGIPLRRRPFRRATAPRTALAHLCAGIFRAAAPPVPADATLDLFIGATPEHEVELIARDLRRLLRGGRLPDGTPVAPGEVAILARDARQVHARLERTFRRFDLALQPEPPSLAHTPVGRALLTAMRLMREDWQREDVLALLKSGYLAVDADAAFAIDLHARAHYLRGGRSAWFARWTDDDTREALHAALAPLADFHDACARAATPPLDALRALLTHFRANAFPDALPLPDEQPEAAEEVARQEGAFSRVERILDDLRNLGPALGGFRHEEVTDVVTTALMRETLPPPPLSREGIRLLSVHATGGEKFKVVYLCNLVEGRFPLHQRESAFFLDHERDETLRELDIRIDTKKSLEADEQYWFLHALSSATHRLVLSHATHDTAGGLLERSCFLDDVEAIVPDLPARARRTTFRQLAPPREEAERLPEFLASVALGLRTETDAAARDDLVAAYAACPAGTLAAFFRRAQPSDGARAPRAHDGPLSASELQAYRDCPFLWFAGYLMRVQPVIEEYSPLDRGMVLHEALERLYKRRQDAPGIPVHLEGCTVDALWPELEADLRANLEAEPRFHNRPRFLQEIERESLLRMMRRVLAAEIARAESRRLHPAYFERTFGYDPRHPVLLDDGTRLCGKIDRIDLADHDPRQAVVVDYKSSSASLTQRAMARGEVLQVPIYLLALRHLFGLTPLGAEFIGLQQSDAKGLFRQEIAALTSATRGMTTLDDVEWQAFLDEAEERIRRLARAMRDGHIPLAPTTDRCPDRCGYFPLCRGNRYELARAVRAQARVDEQPSPRSGEAVDV